MKRTILTFILLLFIINAFAQGSFGKYMQQGKEFYNKNEFLTALERLDLAYEFAKTEVEKNDAKSWKNRTREKIKAQQNDLQKAIVIAKQEKAKSDSLLILSEQERTKNEMFLNLIINYLDFYEGKFALAKKKDMYGFINKQGKEIIEFKYMEATPFDKYTGLAKMRFVDEKKNLDYYCLIDTGGIEYRLAGNTNDLDDSTEAIDLSYKELDTIPAKIFKYKNIKVLLLHFNQIKSIPDAIGNLSNLEILNLDPKFYGARVSYYIRKAGNQINILPEEICNLEKLRELNLFGNKLSDLPSEIIKLNNLIDLNLGENYFESLPAEIGMLKNLRKLNLSSNILKNLPDEIVKLNKLEKILISRNPIISLPLSLRGFLLGKTDLDSNNFELLFYPERRTVINFSNLGLKTVSSDIIKLNNLEYLNLSRNELTVLPKEICELSNLVELNLSINQLFSIPNELVKLKKLEKILISANPIISLPMSLKEFLLGKTDLDSNNFELLFYPEKRTEIDFSNLGLKTLSTEISKLTNLEYLSLTNNQLASLPLEIGQLSNLLELNLRSNHLSHLPSEISKLINLKVMYLGGNNFEESEKLKIKSWLPNCNIIWDSGFR